MNQSHGSSAHPFALARQMLIAAWVVSAPLTHASPEGQELPAATLRFSGPDYDGVWRGEGKVETGNCSANPSMKFTVKGGRIFTDGLTDGVYFGTGSRAGVSKVFGVILQNKSVDLTLLDRNGRGRDSQAYGALTSPTEMQLHDVGDCTYTYNLRKG